MKVRGRSIPALFKSVPEPTPSREEREEPSPLARDRPARLGEGGEDAFGHDDYAAAAAETLIAAAAPFTLGIFGDWGVGKTTIIRGIGSRVRSRGLAFVEFDVWRYEGDALRRQFLREVAQQLKDRGQLPRRYRPEQALRDLEVDVPVPEERFRFSVRGILVAAAHAIVIFVGAYLFLRSHLPERIWGKTSGASSSAQEVAGILAAIGFVYTWLSQILRVEQRFVTLRRIEEPERFQAKFCELLALAKAPRVVIAIDNLDRCSPGLVDALLATIKTYLEPAVEQDARKRSDANAVFVIAADDAAVRRHMTARELEVSPPDLVGAEAPDPRRQRERLREAERHVDEYLRKFFNASIRVRPLLVGDIRSYAHEQLAEFFEKYRLAASESSDVSAGDGEPRPADRGRVPEGPEVAESEARERLVSMVVTALRGNPRRIKQFVNNLDTRLRTIDARERSNRISPRISDDVLGIAKVAIIEEEWRDDYAVLEREHRKLAEWQATVVTGELENEELSAFLRTTRDIVPRNLPAILNLKLEEDDLELPDFGEFRDAVAYGDFAAARRIVEQASADGKEERYSQKLPDLFAREVQGDALSEARNVLDAALQDKPLGVREEAKRRAMVSDAVAHPRLVEQLPALDPTRLFAGLDLLAPLERRRGRQPFLRLAALATQGQDAVRKICLELAKRVSELDEEERETLRETFGVDPWSSQLRAAYLPLIEADPSLLTENAVSIAFNGLSELEVESSELQVVTLGFSARLGGELFRQFLERLQQELVDALSDAARLPHVYALVELFLERLQRADDGQLDGLISVVRSNLGTLVGAEPPARTARFALRVASIADSPVVDDSPTSVAEAEELAREVSAANPLSVAEAVLSEDLSIGPRVAFAIRANLVSALQQSDPKTPEGGTLAKGLVALGSDGVDAMQEEVVRRAALGEAQALVELLRIGGEALSTRNQAIGEALGSAVQTADTTQLEAQLLGFVSAAGELGDVAARMARETLEEFLLEPGGRGEVAVNVLAVEAAQPFEESEGQRLRSHLISRLPEGDFDDRFLPVLSYLVRSWEQLTVEERHSLRRKTVSWLDDSPDYAPEILQALRPFPGGSEDRLPLVRAFLRAAKNADQTWRAQAFAAAFEIADQSIPALRACREALAALESSPNDDDRSVAQDVRTRVGELAGSRP